MLWVETAGTYQVAAIVTTLVTDEAGRLLSMAQVPLAKSVTVTGRRRQTPFENPYAEPSSELRTLLEAILLSSPPRDYAKDRAARFSRLAATVAEGSVGTVGELWELMAAEKAEGTCPATKAAVAGVLTSHIGRADAALDRTEAKDLLAAIAWAIMEASR